MTKTFLYTAIFSLYLAACSPQGAQTNQSTTSHNKHVAITAIVEHPALDNVRKGALDELKAEGLDNVIVDFQSAQGNTSTAMQIAKKLAGDKPDVVLAIGTPSAQSMLSASQDIPIVYAAVTDPIAAKLVDSWEASGKNITGVSDQLPLGPQIELMQKLVPNLKAVGYVYSPSEVNSTVVMEQLKTELAKHNIELVTAPAQRTTDVLTAARSLGGKVQLLYTSLDNNVVASMESMHKAASEIKVPLLASDPGSVGRGAIAALGVNYYDIGKESGKIMAKILKGERAGSIPSQKMSQFDLYISPKNAQALGFTLPDEVKNNKTIVVE